MIKVVSDLRIRDSPMVASVAIRHSAFRTLRQLGWSACETSWIGKRNGVEEVGSHEVRIDNRRLADWRLPHQQRPQRRHRLPAGRSRAAASLALVTPEGRIAWFGLLTSSLHKSTVHRIPCPGHELPRRHPSWHQQRKHPCRRLSSPATGATPATSSRSSARAFSCGWSSFA